MKITSGVTIERDPQGKLLAMHGGDLATRQFAAAGLIEESEQSLKSTIDKMRLKATKLDAISSVMRQRFAARAAVAHSRPAEFRGEWSDRGSYEDGDVVAFAGSFHQRVNGAWWALVPDVVWGEASASPVALADVLDDVDLDIPDAAGNADTP